MNPREKEIPSNTFPVWWKNKRRRGKERVDKWGKCPLRQTCYPRYRAEVKEKRQDEGGEETVRTF